MNVKEWSETIWTEILRDDKALYKTALSLLADKLAKESGSRADEIELFWLRKARELIPRPARLL